MSKKEVEVKQLALTEGERIEIIAALVVTSCVAIDKRSAGSRTRLMKKILRSMNK